MRQSPFRSGSPISDPLGFVGTTLGKRALEEAKKAQAEIRAIPKDMSMNEANQWLKDYYPNWPWLAVVEAKYKTDKNERFPNSEKSVNIRYDPK
jgi:hypothetical protein